MDSPWRRTLASVLILCLRSSQVSSQNLVPTGAASTSPLSGNLRDCPQGQNFLQSTPELLPLVGPQLQSRTQFQDVAGKPSTAELGKTALSLPLSVKPVAKFNTGQISPVSVFNLPSPNFPLNVALSPPVQLKEDSNNNVQHACPSLPQNLLPPGRPLNNLPPPPLHTRQGPLVNIPSPLNVFKANLNIRSLVNNSPSQCQSENLPLPTLNDCPIQPTPIFPCHTNVPVSQGPNSNVLPVNNSPSPLALDNAQLPSINAYSTPTVQISQCRTDIPVSKGSNLDIRPINNPPPQYPLQKLPLPALNVYSTRPPQISKSQSLKYRPNFVNLNNIVPFQGVPLNIAPIKRESFLNNEPNEVDSQCLAPPNFIPSLQVPFPQGVTLPDPLLSPTGIYPRQINILPGDTTLQNQRAKILPLVDTSSPQQHLLAPDLKPLCTLPTHQTYINFIDTAKINHSLPPLLDYRINSNTVAGEFIPFSPFNLPSPNYQITGLPPVSSPNIPCTSSADEKQEDKFPDPINLHINIPATNIPEPKITIITACPTLPAPSIASANTDESDTGSSLGMYSSFPMPPIIIEGTRSRTRNWLPLFLIALFSRNGCCGGGGCGCCPCSGGANIPIPYPIPIPTNNPIILNNAKSRSKTSKTE